MAHNTAFGHKWAITNCWLDMAKSLSTFWEARDHCQIRLLCRLCGIMCQQEHSWLKMREFFKSYFSSVFDHYIRSVLPMFGKESKRTVHFLWQLTALMNSAQSHHPSEKFLKCKLKAGDSHSREREIKQYSLFSTKLALFAKPRNWAVGWRLITRRLLFGHLSKKLLVVLRSIMTSSSFCCTEQSYT